MKTPVEQLRNHVETLQKNYRDLKPQIDKITKDLAALGFKPDEPANISRLPIDDDLIEKAREALKDRGKNVKSLQKALGIFDYAEMTRKRKALTAAGVTRETENYQGTNATFIELNEEPTPALADEQLEPGDESSGDGEEIAAVEPAPSKTATVKPIVKR